MSKQIEIWCHLVDIDIVDMYDYLNRVDSFCDGVEVFRIKSKGDRKKLENIIYNYDIIMGLLNAETAINENLVLEV